MMKDVVINIRTIANTGEDEDYLDFISDGVYSYDGEVGSLSYMESEVTGMEGTCTSVIVRDDEIVVERTGLLTSKMVFREKERSSFLYGTPYGTATMNINTNSIRKSFDENGGNLEIDYVVDMEHTVLTRNKFKLSVTRQMGENYNG